MTNLEELIIERNYYQAKYLFINMKIKKLQLARVSRSESDTDYKKTITNDVITIEPDTDVESSESENENECEDDITIFVKNKIVKGNDLKLKRTDCYICYKQYCELQKLKPKPKPQFFKAIEKILGQPTKTNGIYFYKNYSLVNKHAALLTFNESVEDFIF